MLKINMKFIKLCSSLYLRFKTYFYSKDSHFNITYFIDFIIIHLNAGLTLQQCIELMVHKPKIPIHIKLLLSQVLSLCRRGYSLSYSLDLIQKRIQKLNSYRHFFIVFNAMKIVSIKGVRGTSLFAKIKKKVADENKFRRTLIVLTAQMRLQARVILFSPLLLCLILLILSPEHIFVFFESIFGGCLFIIMMVLNLGCYLALKNILNIKYMT